MEKKLDILFGKYYKTKYVTKEVDRYIKYCKTKKKSEQFWIEDAKTYIGYEKFTWKFLDDADKKKIKEERERAVRLFNFLVEKIEIPIEDKNKIINYINNQYVVENNLPYILIDNYKKYIKSNPDKKEN